MIYLRNRFTGEVIWTYNTEAERDVELRLAFADARNALAYGGQALRLVDLSGDNLAGFDLRGLDLSCANLDSANLTGANLSDSCLAGASIRSATLTGANLAGAQLSGVDFTGSDLIGVNIARAELTDVNFANTRLTNIKLADANLSRIKEDFRVSIDLGPRECVAFLSELRSGDSDHAATKSRPITAKFFRAKEGLAMEDRPCTIAVPWMREYMQERFMVPSVPIDDIAEVVAALLG